MRLTFRPLFLQVVLLVATTFCRDGRRLAVVKAQTTNDPVGDCEAEGNAVAFCISSDPQNSCLTACDGNISPDFAQLSMNDLMDPNVLCPIYQDTLCFIVDCCPLCQAESRLLFECQAAQLNNEAEFCGNTLSVDECDGSSLTNNGGPTTDTENGGTTSGGDPEVGAVDTGDDLPPEDCEAEGNAVAMCLSADPQNTCLSMCGTYTPDYTGLTMGDFLKPDVICPIWQDALCLIVDCCPVCRSEAQLLYECQAKQINNEFCGDILSDSQCDGSSANNVGGGGVGGGGGDAAASLIDSSLLPCLGLILGAAGLF